MIDVDREVELDRLRVSVGQNPTQRARRQACGDRRDDMVDVLDCPSQLPDIFDIDVIRTVEKEMITSTRSPVSRAAWGSGFPWAEGETAKASSSAVSAIAVWSARVLMAVIAPANCRTLR